MKKTYLKQLLTALLLLCSTVVSAETYSGTCGTSVNWSLDTETGVLNITGTGEMTNYSLSNVPWYNYRSNITSVTIGNSVTSIGEYAFYDCSGLTSITIPNSVTSIGDHAFDNCSGITSITIPNSVITIGTDAFWGCTGLTSITIPNSVTGIEGRAFYGCTSLTSITIPNSVTSIGGGAFDDCGGLTSIKVESGNTNYDSRDNCNAIIETATNTLIAGCKNSIIPNSVTSIGNDAFYGCTGLTSITIPNSVTTIGNSAFYGCTGLTSITIPNSVTSIGKYAFGDCSGLTSITIPNSVTSIGSDAFYACSGITSVAIPNSVTSIGDDAFEYTGWYYNQPNGLLYLDGWLLGYKGSKPTGALTINEGTKCIAGSAFSWCTGLTSITIPNSVTSIGIYAFEYCTSLTSVTIPNSVTTIGNSVTTIGDGAFWYCSGLTSVTIGNSVTSIGDCAFLGCTGLTSITIPNSVTSIGWSAFSGCSGITEIYSLAETPARISSSTFQNYSATLYVPIGTKAAYQAAYYWKNFTNIVEMDFADEGTPTEVTITIGQYGTATYCSPYTLDFSEVEGLKAYTATGYNTNTGVVTLTRTQSATEGIGLFLMGEPGEYTVPVIEHSSDYMLNMLVGTLEEIIVNNKTDDGNYVNFKYTIGAESDQPMFYQFTDGSTLSAGKAYLQLPAGLFSSTASKSIGIRFDEGLTTDIDEVESEGNASQAVYDLNGRRVSKPAKGGIYIINGKKVVL